ncbi:RluA family pseudouridine synthase [Pusillimonas sp. CC-YST705]|uniref:Pseudouridine synthase n=1 Tax=Mesopusillimonas faecipullorum TaxID=2755040 RepID=A0ABS8C9D5_9BURK|nr:RluA family pseudouridine synthase [Mesopusillimonas faecipullorum]MCB5362449.1 RluA family pseudouridine synthase [Mesopusillimonas faecipullorum]
MRPSPKGKLSSPPPAAPSVRFFQIDANHAGQRLDNFLVGVCKGVPKSHVYKAIRSGQVRVNKGRAQAEYRLEDGDLVRIPPMRLPQPSQARAVPPGQFPIVFEDDAMLVVDKPAGVAVHGGSGVSFGVIEQLRAARPGEMLELVHRLDRETSGLLMVAKQRKALVALHQLMRESGGRKMYQALVVGDWVNDRQHLRQPLFKWLTPSGERRVRVDPEGKPAHTIVTLLERFGDYSLVQAELRTGRTHQIRVHLASSGFPIVGDEKYGPDAVRAEFSARGFKRMFLHAGRLEIPHPLTGAPLTFEAPLPEACRRLLEDLRARA